MINNVLPRITEWTEFKSVSFYELISLRSCILKGMGKNLILDVALPESIPTRHSLIGIFHHRAMELLHQCETKSELEESIEAEIENLQHEVDRWPHLSKVGSVSGWDEINLSAVAVLRQFQSKKEGIGGIKTIEKTLFSRDKRLVGRPDYFAIKGRRGILRELKAFSLKNEEGKIKSEYEAQLIFYAVLLFDNFDIDAIDASLVSAHGDTYEKVITRLDAENHKEEIIKEIDAANISIKNAGNISNLESVSKDSCSTCQKRIVCDEYKKQQLLLQMDNSQAIIQGTLLNIEKVSGQPVYSAKIQDTFLKQIISILIPESYSHDLKVGGRYCIADLAGKGSNFRWSNQSRVFHCQT